MSDKAKSIILEFVRLGLRYLGMYLVMKGIFDERAAGIFADPMLAEAVGGAMIAGAEYFFIKAKVHEVKL